MRHTSEGWCETRDNRKRKMYYAVHAFAHFHRFGSIDTFQFTFLLKKKTIDKVATIDKES